MRGNHWCRIGVLVCVHVSAMCCMAALGGPQPVEEMVTIAVDAGRTQAQRLDALEQINALVGQNRLDGLMAVSGQTADVVGAVAVAMLGPNVAESPAVANHVTQRLLSYGDELRSNVLSR